MNPSDLFPEESTLESPPTPDLPQSPTPLQDITHLILIDEKTPEVTVDVYIYIRTGDTLRIMAILPTSAIELVDAGLEEHVLHSIWTVPSRGMMEGYLRESLSHSTASGILVVDEMRLSDQVVSHHLGPMDIDGNPVSIRRSKDSGAISSAGLATLKSMHSGLYDTLYTKYRSEACLSK